MLPQQVHVNTGLDIEALQKGLRHHVREISVPLLIPAQQHKMPGLGVKLVHFLEPRTSPGGHIDLTADDGFDSLRLTGPVEIHRPVHHPVVGDGHGGLAQFLYALGQLLDAAGSIQQGKLRMQM